MIRKALTIHKISLSLPRNDRSKHGLTYGDIIADHAKAIVEGNDVVIYLDDVITGTRFRKICGVLESIQNIKIRVTVTIS